MKILIKLKKKLFNYLKYYIWSKFLIIKIIFLKDIILKKNYRLIWRKNKMILKKNIYKYNKN